MIETRFAGAGARDCDLLPSDYKLIFSENPYRKEVT